MKTKLVKEDIPVTYHCSSLITHHFKDYIHLAPSFNFHPSIFFTLFVGPIPVTHCRLFFLSVPKLTEPSEKKKKKNEKKKKMKRKETQDRPKWKKEEEGKKKKRTEQPTRRRKEEKKSQKWSKVATGYYLWVPYVCLITIFPLSYEL